MIRRVVLIVLACEAGHIITFVVLRDALQILNRSSVIFTSQQTHHAEIARVFHLLELFLILLFILGLVASGIVAICSHVPHVGERPVSRAARLVLVHRIKMYYRRSPIEGCLLFDFAVAASCVGLDRHTLVVVCSVERGWGDADVLNHIVRFLLFLCLLAQLKSDLESQV